MNIPDVIFLLSMTLLVQWEALKTCKRNPAISRLYPYIAVGIILWVFYSFWAESVTTNLFNVPISDAMVHDLNAKEISSLIDNEGFFNVLKQYEWRLGNPAYALFVGIIYNLTGTSYISIYLFNGLMAAWGGIILLNIISKTMGLQRVSRWILLITVFFPSTIFWATSNSKEGLMFWAICMSLNIVRFKKEKVAVSTLIGFVVALLTMIVFRPHIAIIWIGAILMVSFVKEGKRRYAVPAFIFFVISLKAASDYTGGWLIEKSTVEVLEEHYEIQKKWKKGSTVIDDSDKPLPFLDGFAMMFIRPYIWEINSIKYAATAFETWGVLLIMIYSWTTARRQRMRLMRNNQLVMLAGIVLVLFAFFFSFQGNLGLIARYKLQAVPAILILINVPLLRKQNYRNKLH